MGSQKKANYAQKKKVDSIFDLIEEGATADLLELAEKTEIHYLKSDEEAWLERRAEPGTYAGISTGYPGVDNLLGSFLPGELLTIGGDTGHGKSLFAFNIAQNVYTKYQRPVMVVSMELTEDQTRERFYELSGPERDYSGILIQASSDISYRDIDTIMEKAKDEDSCLVVIDHLHFFDEALGDNQAAALARIVKHFKSLAVQYEIPVMLLAHVTVDMDHSGNLKRPNLHNLRGSKAISQLSDMVGFVFRNKDEAPNTVEFYISKQRSREHITQSTYLKQKGWRLEEEPLWLPQNSEDSKPSSLRPAKFSEPIKSSSLPEETTSSSQTALVSAI